MADFEWDPNEEESNIRERGIDFTTATLIWDGPIYETVDTLRDYGEIRIVAFGVVESVVLAVVYTWSGEACRIVSARKADRRERRLYGEEIRNRGNTEPD